MDFVPCHIRNSQRQEEFYRFTRDGNGAVIKEQGEVGLIPFLYQGQYLDTETGLAYNRFRYYSPEIGAYISQDPIRLEAGLTNLYAYVHDVNAWIDPWGLIKVSTTVALQDVMNRGLHVNVIEGKKVSMLHSKQLWMERFPRVLNWYLQIPKLGR